MTTYAKLNELTLKLKKSKYQQASITTSKDGAQYARQFYYQDIEIFESMFLILLNKANMTIGYVKISAGGITGTVADPRIIAKYAVDSLATSIILIHNHPSGNLKPSRADQDLTAKIKTGLSYFDITVLDHIILAPDVCGSLSYYSFADEGIL